MADKKSTCLFYARPSLRRAYLYAFLSVVLIILLMIKSNFDPLYAAVWWGALIAILLPLIVLNIKRWCTSYRVTTEEIQVHKGVFSRSISVVPCHRITNASARQPFMDRILGLVTLRIDCAGRDPQEEIVFHHITTGEASTAADLLRKLKDTGSSAT